ARIPVRPQVIDGEPRDRLQENEGDVGVEDRVAFEIIALEAARQQYQLQEQCREPDGIVKHRRTLKRRVLKWEMLSEGGKSQEKSSLLIAILSVLVRQPSYASGCGGRGRGSPPSVAKTPAWTAVTAAPREGLGKGMGSLPSAARRTSSTAPRRTSPANQEPPDNTEIANTRNRDFRTIMNPP